MNNKIINTLSFSLILLIWGASFYDGIETAIEIWTVSEIFTHCLFVIPGACYLVFQKRSILSQQPFKPNYWLIMPLLGTLFLYTFGVVGDIRLFMHIATFISLPLIIWMIIGDQAASKIAFPLYFILFSIPIGEQLIPYLQELTTDIAVPLLELSGVPIYRNGLYLDIPEGRFLVAEACSGISFLIASVVFGNLYAYLSFNTLTKQLVFVFTSVAIPILANALRVYGIVLTAHLTDMEYAAGADHIIYGGVFYAIVLFLLIIIGERFRDKELVVKKEKTEPDNQNIQVSVDKSRHYSLLFFIITLFAGQIVWQNIISGTENIYKEDRVYVNLNLMKLTFNHDKNQNWKPSFKGASETKQGKIFVDNNQTVEFFISVYDKLHTQDNSGKKSELISSLNLLYNSDRWTLSVNKTQFFNSLNSTVNIAHIVSPTGQQRTIFYWYKLDDKLYASKIKMKLYQTFYALLGESQINAVVAFSVKGNFDESHQILVDFVNTNASTLAQLISNH
jgi:exosortase A